jgi:hypothetical protein
MSMPELIRDLLGQYQRATTYDLVEDAVTEFHSIEHRTRQYRFYRRYVAPLTQSRA